MYNAKTMVQMSAADRKTLHKDTKGRAVLVGPRGGVFVRDAAGKKLPPAWGSAGAPSYIQRPPSRFEHIPELQHTTGTSILPLPRTPPATVKEAYENGVRLRALPFKHPNMNTSNLGINAYMNHARKHWPSELYSALKNGRYTIPNVSPEKIRTKSKFNRSKKYKKK
jgi:hypothetical protein